MTFNIKVSIDSGLYVKIRVDLVNGTEETLFVRNEAICEFGGHQGRY